MHLAHRVHNPTVHKLKVSHPGRHLDLGKTHEQTIVSVSDAAHQPAFLASRANAVDNFVALLPKLHELRQKPRRVLEISWKKQQYGVARARHDTIVGVLEWSEVAGIQDDSDASVV